MASFIDLMANDVWTAADIKNRLHAEIRSEISEQAETELNRALQGAIMKMHTLTASEQGALLTFKAATDRASAMGAAARADWILLNKTLVHEDAVKRLAEPVYVPPVVKPVTVKATPTTPTPSPLTPSAPPGPTPFEIDTQERAAAKTVVDAATPDVVALAALRDAQNNPPTPPMVVGPEVMPVAVTPA